MIKNNKHIIHYVPHGINSDVFKSLPKNDPSLIKMRDIIFKDTQYDYVVGLVSRNMGRKHIGDLILAFRNFCDKLPEEESKKCALILHTEPIADLGFHLPVLSSVLCDKYKVILDPQKWSPTNMCCLFNLFDVYVNCSSNEGFGLGVAEAIMCGVPIVATVTGGLQDQLGFLDDNGNPMEFTCEFSTNSCGKYKTHGKWAYPMFPSVRTLHAGTVTPYIIDSLVDSTQITDGLMYWYNKSKEERCECGLEGRRWAMNEGGLNSKNMCDQFIKAMNFTLENFTPNKSFEIYENSSFYDLTKLPNNKLGINI